MTDKCSLITAWRREEHVGAGCFQESLVIHWEGDLVNVAQDLDLEMAIKLLGK